MAITLPTDASIILTYRCPMRCQMCNIWQNPTDRQEEIKASDLRTLPDLKFINLTGGEPFVREDLAEIVEECYRHTKRIVISTSGWFDKKVVELAERFPNIGIRISIEGLSVKNDELRGRQGGFDKGLNTLLTLKNMGVKDIGFGCTNRDEVCRDFEQLIQWQLEENHPKSWFRAFFNMGLINYIEGGRRMLPCEAGMTNFFIDPWGEVYPCNGLEERFWKESMGNIRQNDFATIWNSPQAEHVRDLVRKCPKNCWMVGTASPVMHKYIKHPLRWAVDNKIRVMRGLKPCLDKKWYDVGQDPCQGNLNRQ